MNTEIIRISFTYVSCIESIPLTARLKRQHRGISLQLTSKFTP